MKRRQFVQAGLATIALSSGAEVALSDSGTAPRQGFRRIRIAQWGVRHDHASGKMNDLRLLPDWFDVVGIAAETPELQAKYANTGPYRQLKWMTPEELLALPHLDAVAVETDVHSLLRAAKDCVERGFHVHIDKPLGDQLDQCRDLLHRCQAKGLVIQPGYMFRGNPAVNFATGAVRQGWLGEICDFCADMNKYEVNPLYRQELAAYRGGAMFNIGCHIIDMAVDMLGSPDEIQVIERPVLKDGVSDNTLALLLYPKTIAQLRISFHDVAGFSNRRLYIAGTKGSLELQPMETGFSSNPKALVPPLKIRLTLKESCKEYKAGKHEISIVPPRGRYVNQLIDFARYIRGELKNPYTYDHELLVQRVVLAASGYLPWQKQENKSANT